MIKHNIKPQHVTSQKRAYNFQKNVERLQNIYSSSNSQNPIVQKAAISSIGSLSVQKKTASNSPLRDSASDPYQYYSGAKNGINMSKMNN